MSQSFERSLATSPQTRQLVQSEASSQQRETLEPSNPNDSKASRWGAFRRRAEEDGEREKSTLPDDLHGSIRSVDPSSKNDTSAPVHPIVAGSVGEGGSVGQQKTPHFRQAPSLDDPEYRAPTPERTTPQLRLRYKFGRDDRPERNVRPESSKDRRLGREPTPFKPLFEKAPGPEELRTLESRKQDSCETDRQVPLKPWGRHLRRRTDWGSLSQTESSTQKYPLEMVSAPKAVDRPYKSHPSQLYKLDEQFIGFQDTPEASDKNMAGDTDTAPIEDNQVRREFSSESHISQDAEDSSKLQRRLRKLESISEREGYRRSKQGTTSDRKTQQPSSDDEYLPRRASKPSRDRERRSFNEYDEGLNSFSKSSKPTRRSQAVKDALARPSRFMKGREESFTDFAHSRQQKKALKEQRRQPTAADTDVSQASKPTPVQIPPFINIQNLASLLKVRPEDFTHKLDELGFKNVTMDLVINAENAGLIAMEYNFEPLAPPDDTEDLTPRMEEEDKSSLPQRPPIVTIMGHVDHGKTTLLDYLRKTSVAASEHGGITQHIGAFSVPLPSHENRVITFLDTPGHAAFLTMRQRGANVTDIVVLVVAADDSVKPQTIEAIKHSKAAGVQIVVAITKVDKEEADIQRVKQDLMRYEIEVEQFGGDVQAIEVSGKTGQGVAALEEAIIALADVLDVRADNDGPVEGWILEAATKRAGRAATVLVRRGTLRPGAIVVAGKTWARARTLRNEAGITVSEAPPGTPVEVDGWRDQPMAGDEVLEAPSEQRAITVIDFRISQEQRLKASSEIETMNESRKLESERRIREREAVAEAEAAFEANATATRKEKMEARKAAILEANKPVQPDTSEEPSELFFVIKTDVAGSAEAVTAAIKSIPLGNSPVKISVLRSGVGPISENDIGLAAATPEGNGYILNFSQDVSPSMQSLTEKSGVKLLNANIIYKVIDIVRETIEDWLPPIISSRVTGEAEMLQAFEITGERRTTVKVAGCRVTNGTVSRNSKARVYRGEVGSESTIVFDGNAPRHFSH